MTPVAAPPVSVAATKRNYGGIAEQTWIWSIVGYSLVRFFVAWGAFAEHGANVWIFGLLDVGTAWPYGKAVATVCKRAASSEWKQLPLPLGAAVSMFFAPYAYLWFAAGSMPSGMRVGMAICVSVLLLAASGGALAKTRKLRSEARQGDVGSTVIIDVRTMLSNPDETVSPSTTNIDDVMAIIDSRSSDLHDDVVIDLTGDGASIDRSTLSS